MSDAGFWTMMLNCVGNAILQHILNNTDSTDSVLGKHDFHFNPAQSIVPKIEKL